MTEKELQDLYMAENMSGSLPLMRNGKPLVPPIYSIHGTTTMDYPTWKAFKGYVAEDKSDD